MTDNNARALAEGGGEPVFCCCVCGCVSLNQLIVLNLVYFFFTRKSSKDSEIV